MIDPVRVRSDLGSCLPSRELGQAPTTGVVALQFTADMHVQGSRQQGGSGADPTDGLRRRHPDDPSLVSMQVTVPQDQGCAVDSAATVGKPRAFP